MRAKLYIESNLHFKGILRVNPIGKYKHLIIIKQKVLHSLENTHMRLF
jgi:hypothetical protein